MNNATGARAETNSDRETIGNTVSTNVNTKGNTKKENGPSGYRTRSHKDVPIVRREGRGNRRLGRAAARQAPTFRSASPPHRSRDKSIELAWVEPQALMRRTASLAVCLDSAAAPSQIETCGPHRPQNQHESPATRERGQGQALAVFGFQPPFRPALPVPRPSFFASSERRVAQAARPSDSRRTRETSAAAPLSRCMTAKSPSNGIQPGRPCSSSPHTVGCPLEHAFF